MSVDEDQTQTLEECTVVSVQAKSEPMIFCGNHQYHTAVTLPSRYTKQTRCINIDNAVNQPYKQIVV